MKMFANFTLVLTCLTVSTPAFSSGLQTHRDIASIKKESFKLIHVSDLEALMSQSKNYAILDVNSTNMRKSEGVIPGAKPLSSSSHYDVSKELPQDKSTSLVFYCANTQCTSSHAAAARAVDAGFSDVSVLSDGIIGWKKNGKSVSSDN